jgi:SdrD B-like domain/Secretion system C-terminal sorting domain
MEKTTFKTLCIALLLASTSVFSQGGSDFTGKVLYHENYGLSGVNAYLRVAGGNIIDTAVTDADGMYEFENVTPGNYVISFTTEQQEGGIELSDAFLVMLKLFNMYTFTDIQFLAADVNCSGTITWGDYFMILIGYLNQGNPFPQPWVFESISTPIPDPSRTPFTSGGGSSSGDVNGSLQPDPKSRPIFLENPFTDITASSSDALEFNLTSPENLKIAGMQLIFSIPEELEVTNIECAIPEATMFISDNRLRVTWIDETMNGIELSAGTPLLVISTKSNSTSREMKSYSLNLKEDSHFIDPEGQLVEGLKLSLPTLNVRTMDNLTCSVYPNPFSNAATIEFTLPEESTVVIALYDQAGRRVQEIANKTFAAGLNKVQVDGTRLLPGIYHYTASLENGRQNFSVGTIIKSK